MVSGKRLKKLLKEMEERTDMDTSMLEKELIPHEGEETGIKTKKKERF